MKVKFSFVLLFLTGIFLVLTLTQCTPKSSLVMEIEKTNPTYSQASQAKPQMPTPGAASPTNQAKPQMPTPGSTSPTNQAKPQVQAAGSAGSSIPLGINISGRNDWATEWMFIDLMKSSREWYTMNEPSLAEWNSPNGRRDPFDTKLREMMPADSNGYPLSVPFTVSNAAVQKAQTFFNQENEKAQLKGQKPIRYVVGATQKVKTIVGNYSYPSGRYHVIYDGVGDLDFYAGRKNNLPLAQATKIKEGLYYLDLADEHQAIIMTINSSQKSNPLKNIKIIPEKLLEKFNQGEIFHPLFIERLQELKVSVLRFVDYQKSFNNPITSLQDGYVSKNYYTQGSIKGGSIIYAAQLGNKLKADIWVHIPVEANDEYISKLASEISNTLDKAQKVYVEYSNELWNYAFSQTTSKNKMGCADKTTFVSLKLNPNSCDEHRSGIRYQVKRSAEIFNIFEAQLGADRLVKVIAGQAPVPWLGDHLLSLFDDTQINPTKQKPDAYAIAPYFGYSTASQIGDDAISVISTEEILKGAEEEITPDPQLLQQLLATKNFQEYTKLINTLYDTNQDKRIDEKDQILPGRVIYAIIGNKKVADDYGVKLVTYEAGQHLVATGKNLHNDEFTNKFIAVNRDPQMGKIYLKYFDNWYLINPNGLFMHYNNVLPFSKFGSWGLLEYQDQDINTAPKYLAVKKYAECLKEQKGGNCS